MPRRPDPPGWTWFDPPPASAADQAQLALARQTARLLGTPDGLALLAHLRQMTLDRCLGPESGDAALRHLEGQRHLVLHLLGLVERGRAGG